MANYLEIRNPLNNNLLISDSARILQPTLSIHGAFTAFYTRTFTTTSSWQARFPYTSSAFDVSSYVGHPSIKGFGVYRLSTFGSSSTASTMTVTKDTAAHGRKLVLNTTSSAPVNYHYVELSQQTVPAPIANQGLIALDENSNIVFDAGLGSAHYLASINTQVSQDIWGNTSILIGTLSTLDNFDVNRIFINVSTMPYKMLVSFTGGGTQYRMGWYVWHPTFRLDGLKLYVDLTMFSPTNYGGSLAGHLNLWVNMTLFYLPNIRLEA